MQLADNKLLAFVQTDSSDINLVHILQRHFRKNDTFDLCENSDLLDAAQLSTFWQNIRTLVQISVEKIEEQIANTDGNSKLHTNDSEKWEPLGFLKLVASFQNQYLEGNHRRPGAFLDTLELFHDLLLNIICSIFFIVFCVLFPLEYVQSKRKCSGPGSTPKLG